MTAAFRVSSRSQRCAVPARGVAVTTDDNHTRVHTRRVFARGAELAPLLPAMLDGDRPRAIGS